MNEVPPTQVATRDIAEGETVLRVPTASRLGSSLALDSYYPATIRMKLQLGRLPFPLLRLWMKPSCHTPVPWRFTGISRPLLVSRLPSEGQRKADSF